jgi:HK97 gp10 family phage protein
VTDIKFSLTGFEDLKRTLEELNTESATKVGTVATREGAKMVKDALVQAAPVGTEPTTKTRRTKSGKLVTFDYGRLKDNIRIRKLKGSNQHQIKFAVGIGSAFWGLFSEFGSRHQAAKPWLRPAFDVVGPRVIQEIGRLLGVGITREAKRLGRKAKKLGIDL